MRFAVFPHPYQQFIHLKNNAHSSECEVVSPRSPELIFPLKNNFEDSSSRWWYRGVLTYLLPWAQPSVKKYRHSDKISNSKNVKQGVGSFQMCSILTCCILKIAGVHIG